jgi:PAS domain S-box-containing protein
VATKDKQEALPYAPGPQRAQTSRLPRQVPLRAAEATWRELPALLELAHDSIFVRGMDGVVTYWNQGAEALFGWTAAEAVGQAAHQLLQTVFPAPIKRINEALLCTGRWEGELQHIRKDGTPVVVASRWALQRDGHGAPVAVLQTSDAITERKRAERELEEQWRAAFEANPTMYFIVDQAGAIVSVNPFGARQLGYAVSELVGQPVLKVFYEPDRAFVQKKAASCFSNLGRPLRWEARKLRKDGKMIWVRETANAVMLRSRPVLLVACEDVTDQKRVEEALRDSEERFRTLVQFSFDVYWETDAQHRFVRQVFDRTVTSDWPAPGAELGKTRWEVPYLEPDEEAWRRHRETLDAHLPFRDFELARPTPEGGKRYVSVSGLPVFDESGKFLGYRGVGRHITERKRAEEMLRQREKELRDIIETMPAMAFVTDAGGRNAMGNRRWHEYTGLGPDAVNSKAAVHPDDAARYTAARRHSIDTGEPFEQEVRLRRFDGEFRWFLGRAVPLRDEQGKVLKWYGVHTDIHDRKLAEEERAGHLWFLESMDRINRAMQGTNDLERMMSDVLDAVLEVFACDRAWLVYPCDPEAPSWRAVMEHTRPQFPGALALGTDVPLTPDVASVFRTARAADGAVLFGPGHQLRVPGPVAERFATRSQMVMAVCPKVDRAYLFGLHQCSHARVWSEQERRLFEEIGRHLDDALTSLLIFRSLRESERKLEEAQRIGHMGYFELDVRNQRMSLSDEACRIHGLEQHQLASWQGRMIELVHPDDRARVADAMVAAGKGDGRFDFEFRALRTNGEVRIVHSRGEATRDTAGGGLRAFGTLQDITELRHTQEELSASEQLTRNIFESAPDAMGVIGRDYRYQRLNPVYERNWKMPAEKIVGLHVSDLHGSEVFEQILKPKMDRCFAGEQVSFAEWFVNTSGRFYFSVIYAPLRLGSERVEAALAITRDLTDHMLASEALRQAEAALARVNRVTTLGVLAASIAHEVNQPLGAITTSAAACSRWLGAQPPDMEKARSALQRIVADGRRAAQVVDRIRALVNRQAPRRNRVDLNEAILEVIALTRDEMRRNAITLKSSLAPDVPPIQGDRVQLQQVVLNLIVNAIEAMKGSGARWRELAIGSARDGGDAVTVEVRDSGPGIDADHVDRLFEAFYTTKEEGIGMGLSISRSIIEAHGGQLWVTSNVPHGAIFRFSLPALQPVS